MTSSGRRRRLRNRRNGAGPPRFVGCDELLVGGEVHHDAHFDLRVVGGEQTLVLHTVDGCGRDDEGATDAALLRCGSGCSAGSARSRRVDRWRRHPAGRWCARVRRRRLLSAYFDGLYEFDVVAVGGERTEECGTVGLRGDFGEQFGDGFGVGGVAGLDFAGVRQGELVEEHGLQLFDGGEVEGFFAVVGLDGVADDGACGVLRLVSACGEGVVQFGKERVGDGDACLLHVCEDVK